MSENEFNTNLYIFVYKQFAFDFNRLYYNNMFHLTWDETFSFQVLKYYISVRGLFFAREESQEDLGIPKAQDFDQINKYFSCLLQPSSETTLNLEKNKSHLMFNELCYKNDILPTYTNIDIYYVWEIYIYICWFIHMP